MNRTNNILREYRLLKMSRQQTINALYNLKDWARAEVADAATDAYRNTWQRELKASQDAIAALLRGDS